MMRLTRLFTLLSSLIYLSGALGSETTLSGDGGLASRPQVTHSVEEKFLWLDRKLKAASNYEETIRGCRDAIGWIGPDSGTNEALGLMRLCSHTVDVLNDLYWESDPETPEEYEHVLRLMLDNKFGTPFVDHLRDMKPKMPFFWNMIKNGWPDTWFNPEAYRETVLFYFQAMDEKIRRNSRLTGFYDAPSFQIYQNHIDMLWRTVQETNYFRPRSVPVPQKFSWFTADVEADRIAAIDFIEAVGAYKGVDGFQAVIDAGERFYKELGTTAASTSGASVQAWPAAAYLEAREGAIAEAESWIREFGIDGYLPILTRVGGVLVDQKPKFKDLTDEQKKAFDDLVDKIWAQWDINQQNYLRQYIMFETPSYRDALRTCGGAYDALNDWKRASF